MISAFPTTPSRQQRATVVSFSEALEKVDKPKRHYSLTGKLALLSIRRSTKR